MGDPSRRTVLRDVLTLLAVGGTPALGAGGCSPARTVDEAAASEPLVVPLAALPPGERVRVVHRGRPIELRREGQTVVARSLSCTHFGCEVRWDPARDVYACPCHEGAFAPDGAVVAGPPSRPLPALEVRVDRSHVYLEGG